VDVDGNGSFETTRTFHRLFGDVNGDLVVDLLDSQLVLNATGLLGLNLAADVNGDGLVTSADVVHTKRQRGRRIMILG